MFMNQNLNQFVLSNWVKDPLNHKVALLYGSNTQ